MQPGSLVRYREREWVVLPSPNPPLLLLRPIGGSSREICGVIAPLAELAAYTLPYERIKPAQFPLPSPDDVQDHAAVRLLLAGARLLLREGAAPFRSLGRLSFRPRPYQFVPLLMALRLDKVRVLIADDVGVGKTIEAGLIARELVDRGEVSRMAVLCPPYLCDQW
ncbi:MAG: helicase, partial [Thermoleophilia bacterium]|nr:helicase [Thermoleophilia bacterium]